MKYRRLIVVCLGAILILIEILIFLFLDREMYLHKGFSVRKYDNILLYDTKIQRDQNVSGFYYFIPTSKYGLELCPNNIFLNGVWPEPTVIYHEEESKNDTVYLTEICRYGYNDSELVIEVRDSVSGSFWLQPKRISKKEIRLFQIDAPLNKRAYHWVSPRGCMADGVSLTWLWLLLILFPSSIVGEIFLIVYVYGEKSRNIM